MNANFEIKSYSLESIVCALLLMFASFSVLPLSVAIVEVKDESPVELVRVYSRDDFQKEQTNRKQNSVSLPNANFAMQARERAVPSIDVASPDFSSVKVGLPDLKSGTNFEITSFGVDVGELGNSDIVVFELSGLDKIPRRLNNVHVKYPADMLRRGIEGEVRLNVIIDELGNLEVESVASSTNTRFEESAIKSASKFKYEIPMRAGKPVRAKFVLPIPFKILK